MVIRENGEIKEITSNRNDLHNTYSVKNHVPHFVPSYKNLYLNQLLTNKGLLIALGISWLLFFMLYLGTLKVKNTEIGTLKHDQGLSFEYLEQYRVNEEALLNGLASCSAQIPKKNVSIGRVSYYSKDGCIGCSPIQRMANGEIFDETQMTLAHNNIPLNTIVLVKNLNNGKQMTAKVTDRGGFNKYNRIADLSLGLYNALEAKTDVTVIEISY